MMCIYIYIYRYVYISNISKFISNLSSVDFLHEAWFQSFRFLLYGWRTKYLSQELSMFSCLQFSKFFLLLCHTGSLVSNCQISSFSAQVQTHTFVVLPGSLLAARYFCAMLIFSSILQTIGLSTMLFSEGMPWDIEYCGHTKNPNI